jgi:hypothetical protein
MKILTVYKIQVENFDGSFTAVYIRGSEIKPLTKQLSKIGRKR